MKSIEFCGKDHIGPQDFHGFPGTFRLDSINSVAKKKDYTLPSWIIIRMDYICIMYYIVLCIWMILTKKKLIHHDDPSKI